MGKSRKTGCRQVCACTLYSVHAYNALRGGQRVGAGGEKRLFVMHKDGKHIWQVKPSGSQSRFSFSVKKVEICFLF